MIKYYFLKFGLIKPAHNKLNLGSGGVPVPGYINIDVDPLADLKINLARKNFPFEDDSMEAVVCISTINYFSRARARELIKETYRILKPGGIARFATQDLKLIAKYYVDENKDFFFQKLPNGKDRFRGQTMGDKFNEWFYGYKTYGGRPCRYFYDFETLKLLFKEAGFKSIEKKEYLESDLGDVDKIDNRSDQMFFLEAIK